jgi:hypothetical protein
MMKWDKEEHRIVDPTANKECAGEGVKILERKVYPSKVYPCKANLQTDQRKQKRTILT